jgi:polyketide synthase 12
LSAKDIEPVLSAYDGRLEIAGDIGPHTATVAGDLVPLEHMVTVLNGRDVQATVIPASIPSHCFAIEPLRDRPTDALTAIRPRPTQIPMYSTVTAAVIDGRELSAEYWYDNVRQPVSFQPAMRNLLSHGARVFVESSAHPVLTSAITATAQPAGIPVVVTGTLRRGHGDYAQFLTSLAQATASTPQVASAA